MHRLKNMKETLVGCVQAQLANIANADTEELGQAIDMIKDLEEAMYYCSKIKEMEDCEKEHKEMKEKLEKMEHEHPQEFHHFYTERLMPYLDPMVYGPMGRDMDREKGRMYYSERQPRNSQGEFTSRGRSGGGRYYDEKLTDTSFNGSNYNEREMPFDFRDSREGRSPMSRRNYMESKEMHQDKDKKMKELEKYMKELSEDIVEMIEDASPEEKQMLEKKMTHLTSKIAQLNSNA